AGAPVVASDRRPVLSPLAAAPLSLLAAWAECALSRRPDCRIVIFVERCVDRQPCRRRLLSADEPNVGAAPRSSARLCRVLSEGTGRQDREANDIRFW